MTDEEIEAMKKAYVDLAISAMTFQEQVMKAFVPVIEATAAFYAAVPEEIKELIAQNQVQEMLDKINIEALPEKEKWIAERLKTYDKYWNPEKHIYEIDIDTENAWTPSRDKLLEDLNKSWEFEHGKSA